jgi:hypothetical protein
MAMMLIISSTLLVAVAALQAGVVGRQCAITLGNATVRALNNVVIETRPSSFCLARRKPTATPLLQCFDRPVQQWRVVD